MKPGAGSPTRSERGVYALIAIIALVIIYLIAFVLKNTRSVRVSFVFASTTASLIWVLLVSILLGIVLGLAASRLGHVRPSRRARAAQASASAGSSTSPGGIRTAPTSGPLTGGSAHDTQERTVVRPSPSPGNDAPRRSGSSIDDGPTTKL
jgi:uncharacterized integral membrane protein